MKSQVSLPKNNKQRKSAFVVNYINNLKTGWLTPILSLLMLCLFYPLCSYLNISVILKENLSDNLYKISENFTYILSNSEAISKFNSAICFLLLIAGLYLGFTKFKFMNKKNEVNVFFSLGITRTKLFTSTFLAGLTQIAASIILPMLGLYFINLRYFGNSKELFLTILYLTIGFILTNIIGFSISSFVASNVGSNSELIFYSLVLIALPSVILTAIESFASLFVLGNEFGICNSSIRSYVSHSLSLSDKFSYLIPSNIIADFMKNYVILDANNQFQLYAARHMDSSNISNLINWISPRFARIISWSFISLGINALNVYFINKRPAERAGFLGASKKANAIMSFILSFSSSIICINTLRHITQNSYKIILTGSIIFIVVYMITNFVLTRKIRPFIKTLKMLPIHIALLACIVLIFSTGLFGYSQRVPDISDIKSVEMIIPGGRTANLTFGSGSADNASANLSCLQTSITDFKTKKDFKQITSIHKALIKDGVKYSDKKFDSSKNDINVYGDVYIRYTLKNGKSLTRYFESVKASTLTNILDMENSDRYKEILKDEIKNLKPKDEFKNVFYNQNYNVYVMSSNLDVREAANLTKEQKIKLQNAIYEDLTSNTSKDINMSKSSTLGVIGFYSDGSEFLGREDEFLNKKNIITEDKTQHLENSKNQKFHYDNIQTISQTPASYKFIVTTDMKNTIKFLEDNGLMHYLDPTSKIVKAEVIDKRAYYSVNSQMLVYNLNNSYLFVGGRTSKEFVEKYDSMEFENPYSIEDENTIGKLKSNSYFSYFVPQNCYFVRYTLDNGDKIVMCIPKNKIPSNVKKIVDNKKIEIPDLY